MTKLRKADALPNLRLRRRAELDLLAAGLTAKQVVEELPDLDAEDVAACLRLPASGSITRFSLLARPVSARSR